MLQSELHFWMYAPPAVMGAARASRNSVRLVAHGGELIVPKMQSRDDGIRVIKGTTAVLLWFWGCFAVLLFLNSQFAVWATTADARSAAIGMAIFFVIALIVRQWHSRAPAVLLLLCTILGLTLFITLIAEDCTSNPGLLTADAITIIVGAILLWTSVRATIATSKLHKMQD